MLKSHKRIKTKTWNLTNSRRQILSISFLSFFYSSFCQRKYVSVDRWQNQSEPAVILVVVIHYSHLLWPVARYWWLVLILLYIWGRILNICVELFSGTLSHLFPIYAKFRGTNVGFGNDTGTFSKLPHFPSSLGLSLVKGSLVKAGGGRKEPPPTVACSSRNAA